MNYQYSFRWLNSCLFILLSTVIHLSAQDCNFPLPPSNICANAPLLCDLDGYCSDNAGATGSGTPNAFCGQVENNNWISFIAGSTTLEIKVSVFGCSQNQGLQVHVFETDDCSLFISKSNCLDPVANGGTGIMLTTELEIGHIYYLMMDGKGGDVCQYSYELLQGITLSPATVEIMPPPYLCTGDVLTLEANLWSSNPGLMPQWTTLDGHIISGESTNILVIGGAGTYNVSVEDASGCTDSTSILVEESLPPIADAGMADTLNCLNNTTINLDGSNSSAPNTPVFQWSTIDGNIISGENTSTPTVNTPGLYFLTVIDQLTQCSTLDTVNVPIDANTPFAVVGSDGELNCITFEVNLSGIGSSIGNNFEYQWTSTAGNIISGEETLFAIADAPGIYELQVSNLINGCVATAEIEVILNQEKSSGAKITTFAPCYEQNNGRIQIDSVFGGTPQYLFSFGDSILSYTNEADFLPSGEYQIVIKDNIGCEWDTLVMVASEVQLLADLGKDFYLPIGCEYELIPLININRSQLESFTWTPTDLFDCDTCFNQIINPLETTQTYHFTYTDINGCTASDAITIYLDRTRNIFIPNVFSPNNDGINDLFYIYGGKDVAKIRSFRIFNRWGSLLHEANDFAPNDPTFAWDGKFQGKNITGNVFTYVAEVEFFDGWSQTYTGSVVLMR